ncbi:MAG: TraM recognition domain-containing protein [Anaerolineae bacterium]|nr:TraM recognition domain-containing protein [Anaerolineae bacterium]
MIYGAEGTQALFTGLATQFIYGGCDADTADFYSKASGTATTDANQDDPNSHLRQRPLLTVDEVITPQVGNCTIFAWYVEAGFATQVVLYARLTRFYEREDWKARLARAQGAMPLLLERGLELKLQPPEKVKNLPDEPSPLLERAAEVVMDKMAVLATDKAGGKVKTDSLNAMKSRRQQRRQQPPIRLELSA